MLRHPFGAGAIATLALTAAVGAAPLFHSLEFVSFSAPVGLPGVTLVAGDYAFDVAQVDGCDVVRVRYRRSNRVSFAGPTVRIARPRNAPLRQSIMLGQARAGNVAPILVWFPMDELVGYQFMYAHGGEAPPAEAAPPRDRVPSAAPAGR